MRRAWRKVRFWVIRYTRKVKYGYIRTGGFRWKWRRFRLTRKFRGFVRRIKCVVLRKAVKKVLRKLVFRIRTTIIKYRHKLIKFLKRFTLTKRSKRIIHKKITKIFRYAKKCIKRAIKRIIRVAIKKIKVIKANSELE